ncbi:MAG: response regulator [Gemmatimonadota bacterium]
MTAPANADILLVEDSDADAELTTRALRKGRVVNPIHLARDGQEAIDFLAAAATLPRVVLLDLKLPKKSGIEVLEWIRAEPRTRTLPVVMLTSSREEPDIARCYALGVNSYIVKPVEFDAFAKAVVDIGLYWMLLNEPAR